MDQYERLNELLMEDATLYKNFVRIQPAMFQELLTKVGPRISKQDTFWRKALEPGLRIAITLRYLATGNSYKSLMYGFRVAHNTISNIIPEVCEAIIAEYAEDVISCPTTPEEWREVAQLFETRWNFPHCMWPSGVLPKVVHSAITTRASISLYLWLLWMQTTSSSM